MRMVFSKIVAILSSGVDAAFPSRCVACGVPVRYGEHCLCGECSGRVAPAGEGCGRCSGFMAGGECTVCSNRMFYISRNVVAAEYAGVVEEALHHFKFNRRKRLRVPLGELACGEFRRRGIEADLVTAVPMSISKKWKRGFNQSEMVARVVARRLGKPYRNLLRERLWSPTQRHLRPRDRFVNVLGRYRVCSPAKVRGMRILLVDDIFTTGATMNECARVLMQSGAVEVNSLAVARAGIKKLEKL